MKIRISYFYQIRNFKKNMVPMSTAVYDPLWYHNFTGDYGYLFTDKRGILNGLRLKPIILQQHSYYLCNCPCDSRQPDTCFFLKDYKQKLETIDFEKMMHGIRAFADQYQKENKINKEIIMVLIVYETPDNKCSERQALIDYFNNHGIECKELEYPIQ